MNNDTLSVVLPYLGTRPRCRLVLLEDIYVQADLVESISVSNVGEVQVLVQMISGTIHHFDSTNRSTAHDKMKKFVDLLQRN
jgi:hypothetical protein